MVNIIVSVLRITSSWKGSSVYRSSFGSVSQSISLLVYESISFRSLGLSASWPKNGVKTD